MANTLDSPELPTIVQPNFNEQAKTVVCVCADVRKGEREGIREDFQQQK